MRESSAAGLVLAAAVATAISAAQAGSYGQGAAATPRGKILFVRGFDQDAEIYTVPARGGRARRLTRNAVSDVDPRWSPNGRTIAFTRRTASSSAIWLMDASGARQRRLTGGKAGVFDSSPWWSPDGRWLVFSRQGEGFGLYVLRRDGRGLHALAGAAEGRAPQWSPNGKRILFDISGATGHELRACSTACASSASLTSGQFVEPGIPAWTPDSRRVVFRRRVSSAVGWEVAVAPGDRRLALGAGVPAVSPRRKGAWKVTYVDSANRLRVRVLHPRRGRGPGILSVAATGEVPAWSPDAGWIAFRGFDGIYVVAVDRSSVRHLVKAQRGKYVHRQLSWQPRVR